MAARSVAMPGVRCSQLSHIVMQHGLLRRDGIRSNTAGTGS